MARRRSLLTLVLLGVVVGCSGGADGGDGPAPDDVASTTWSSDCAEPVGAAGVEVVELGPSTPGAQEAERQLAARFGEGSPEVGILADAVNEVAPTYLLEGLQAGRAAMGAYVASRCKELHPPGR